MFGDVVWLSYKADVPNKGYWDYELLKDILSGAQYKPANYQPLNHCNSFDEAINVRCVVVPGRYHGDQIERLNADLAGCRRPPVVIVAGDEENEFDVTRLKHYKALYVMSPHPYTHHGIELTKIGSGYPADCRAELAKLQPEDQKTLDWFFAGQITHRRRVAFAEAMREMEGGELLETPGFTQGFSRSEYYQKLARARVAPCPVGPQTPDTFRLWEALEAGCVPIADSRTDKGHDDRYWEWFFDTEPPFPTIWEVDNLPSYVAEVADQYPALNNKVFAWWQQYKASLAYRMFHDMGATDQAMTTVIVPTSPIPSHPETQIIEETIESVRSQLPNAQIIITIDGIRKEQQGYREVYEEYTRRLLWLCNHHWQNVVPVVHQEHQHQARMMRDALRLVHTPLVLYVEHDTPLTADRYIDWAACERFISSGMANVVRFSHEEQILPDHSHLVVGEPMEAHGGIFTPTAQWSQRPHLANVAFYRRMLDQFFAEDARTMIEDVLHSPVQVAFATDGRYGWQQYAVWLYTPEGGIKRSYHTDGRGSDPKW